VNSQRQPGGKGTHSPGTEKKRGSLSLPRTREFDCQNGKHGKGTGLILGERWLTRCAKEVLGSAPRPANADGRDFNAIVGVEKKLLEKGNEMGNCRVSVNQCPSTEGTGGNGARREGISKSRKIQTGKKPRLTNSVSTGNQKNCRIGST